MPKKGSRKGKEPVHVVKEEEKIQTPFVNKEEAREEIKRLWVEMSDKLIRFHTFMCTDVAKHCSAEYMETYHKNVGTKMEEGKEIMKKNDSPLHPLGPRIAAMCFFYRGMLSGVMKKLEDESVPLEEIKLPDNLVEEPEKMIKEVPRPLLIKIFRFMQNFVVIWIKIQRLETIVSLSAGQ